MGRRSIRKALATLLRSVAGPVWPAPIAPVPVHEALECPLCRSHFLCPADWGEQDEGQWWVLARCGECGVWTEAVITNAQAARLDRVLDRQLVAIRQVAERLEAERMAAEAAVFIDALNRDLIDAADFA
jgi:hypothetical protein